MAEYDKVTQASLNGIYVKAQELDRGHNSQDAPMASPAGRAVSDEADARSHASDAQSHASTHASDAESHPSNRSSDAEPYAADSQTHASDGA